MIGTTINDRYDIKSELGQGGMGVVYRAHDSVLKRDVAIKVLSKSRLETEWQTRMVNEAQMVAKLNHPNIVTVFDVGEVDSTPFIVMELVEGKNLRNQPPKDLDETVEIARQLCQALDHAHEKVIIHRDIKPENVVITSSSMVKLMDFGLARSVASRLTEEGAIVGTVSYLSPEQAFGGEIDHRADLYSLGVMLYELTTGQLPYTADNFIGVITQHINAPVVPPRAKNDQIPKYLNDLIVRLMSKNPDDRPASAGEVLNLLSPSESQIQTISQIEELPNLDRIVRGRLVGRDVEVAESRKLWKLSQSGIGQLLLISGEPGVGKSRLMREIVTQAEVSGGQAFIGESHAEGNAPYAAFAQIACRVLRAHQDNGLEIPNLVMAELITIAPELRFYYPDIPPNPPLEPDSERRRLFESVVHFITSLSETNPLLLVLEDIHWADSGTLALLQVLAQRCRELPVMLLSTYREVELDEALPFREVLLDLNRRNLGTLLKLESLNPPQTKELLSVIFAEEITSEFTDGIYKKTEGNPFFVEEVCKTLVESGELYFAEGEWHRPDMDALSIPQNIKVAIQSRLNKLSKDTQEILLNAAVVGREFDYEILLHVTSRDEEALIDGLEEALKAQLIEELMEEGNRFRFLHALIPATLRELISRLRCSHLHSQVAEVLEKLHPNDYDALVHHFTQAGITDKSLFYLRKAGDNARSRYANQDALRYYTRALNIAKSDDIQTRFELFKTRASIYDLLGDRKAQGDDLTELESLAKTLGDQQAQVEIILDQADYAERKGDFSDAILTARRAVELAKEIGKIEEEARGYAIEGKVLALQGNFEKAQEKLLQSIEIVQDVETSSSMLDSLKKVEASSLNNLALINYQHNDYEKAKDYLRRALQIYREIKDVRMENVMKLNLGHIFSNLGELSEAAAFYNQALDTFQEIGDLRNESKVLVGLGNSLLKCGKYAHALRYHEEGLEISRVIEDRYTEGQTLASIGCAAYELGNYDLAKDVFDRALEISQEIGNQPNEAYSLMGLGDVLLEVGQIDEAMACYHNALEIFHELNQIVNKMQTIACLANVALRRGDLEHALYQIDTILEYLETDNSLVLSEVDFWVNLICFRVLNANQDMRAEPLLRNVFLELQERARKINDKELRTSFLENIPSHREILKEAKARGIATIESGNPSIP